LDTSPVLHSHHGTICNGSVGDSPKGHQNNRGETRLKPAKHKSTRTPKTHTQHNRDPGGPHGPPVQRSGRPSSEVRLARGLHTPSGGVRLARGLAPPRAGYAPLEGTLVRISRAPTHTCSRTRVRAFNALTQQGRTTTLTRLGITPPRYPANSRGEAIPAAVQHCAARPVSAP
jgi:hypothetical protein